MRCRMLNTGTSPLDPTNSPQHTALSFPLSLFRAGRRACCSSLLPADGTQALALHNRAHCAVLCASDTAPNEAGRVSTVPAPRPEGCQDSLPSAASPAQQPPSPLPLPPGRKGSTKGALMAWPGWRGACEQHPLSEDSDAGGCRG